MSTVKKQDVVFNSYIGYDYSLSLDSKLGCNLDNTPIITTYPTAPTSSKGTYIFSDNGSTKILTAGGSNDKSGVIFDVCSTSTAPYSVLTVNKNGLTAKELTAYDGSNTGKLTTTELSFNGINYKSIIENNSTAIELINGTTIPEINTLTSLHTSQIANLSAVDVVELAKLSDLELVDTSLKARLTTLETKQPLIISTPIYHVKSVYADSTGFIDYIPATVSNVTPYTGFYYKNNLNEKVNWYIGPDVNMTVGDLKGFMLNFYNISATTGLGAPFVAVYTKIDNITPNSASWYKSRKTFSVDYQSAITINTPYALLANLKSLTYSPQAYNHTKINATSIPGNDKGPFSDSEQILFFSISTASNSSAGLFEFIASKFTILSSSASNEFVFQSK